MAELKIKAHTRVTKTGKRITVKAHIRRTSGNKKSFESLSKEPEENTPGKELEMKKEKLISPEERKRILDWEAAHGYKRQTAETKEQHNARLAKQDKDEWENTHQGSMKKTSPAASPAKTDACKKKSFFARLGF